MLWLKPVEDAAKGFCKHNRHEGSCRESQEDVINSSKRLNCFPGQLLQSNNRWQWIFPPPARSFDGFVESGNEV